MRHADRRVLTFGLDAPAGDDDFGVLWHAGVRWLARGGERLMLASDLRLAGDHNIANALAALALGHAIGLPMAPMCNVLQVFRGLPHRVELVVEADGIAFFDDSKGTNVGATVAALAGLGRPAVLIAGGDGKGQDFTPLGPVVSKHARAVILIGRDAPAIEAALAGWGVPLAHARSMDDAVAQAIDIAGPGDAVLLSPACASLDMFRNYAHRAEVFVAAVRRLTGVRA
jgi:UDP-N-acetylmuramoylalanine--D-glutamate ligase